MPHAPGPWTASQYLDNEEWGVLSEDNAIIVGLSSRITKADAHLIAAAPELLDALKNCVSNFNFARIAMDPKSSEVAGALVDDYRKIIAKAEGKP
jgi:hypothetical protein